MSPTFAREIADRYDDPDFLSSLGNPEPWSVDWTDANRIATLRYATSKGIELRIKSMSPTKWFVAMPDDSCLTGPSGRVRMFKSPGRALEAAREAGVFPGVEPE